MFVFARNHNRGTLATVGRGLLALIIVAIAFVNIVTTLVEVPWDTIVIMQPFFDLGGSTWERDSVLVTGALLLLIARALVRGKRQAWWLSLGLFISSFLGVIISRSERNTILLARADEEQMLLDREPVRLDLLAFDVAATMEPLAIERGIELQVRALEPATVSGDTARLIQVFMGLVDNALTYTNAGGTVELSVEARGAVACLTVRDTGIGIAEKDVPYIFERFYRADPARSRAVGGSGLGLSIAHWVIQAHGGSITVESHAGQGSTFTVKLPLVPSTPAQSRTGSLTPAHSSTAEK